jgi:hypothetical protein
MKNLLVIIFLLTVSQAFSQRKKKEDAKDAQIDTLTKANAALSLKLDSVSKDYNGIYTTLKEKVLLKDYNPEDLSKIIDSIRATRDSTTSLLSVPLKDSLAFVVKENAMLRAKLDSMSVTLQNHVATMSTADKTKLMAELKDLKALLDAKVITQAEFDEKKKLVMEKWQ